MKISVQPSNFPTTSAALEVIVRDVFEDVYISNLQSIPLFNISFYSQCAHAILKWISLFVLRQLLLDHFFTLALSFIRLPIIVSLFDLGLEVEGGRG